MKSEGLDLRATVGVALSCAHKRVTTYAIFMILVVYSLLEVELGPLGRAISLPSMCAPTRGGTWVVLCQSDPTYSCFVPPWIMASRHIGPCHVGITSISSDPWPVGSLSCHAGPSIALEISLPVFSICSLRTKEIKKYISMYHFHESFNEFIIYSRIRCEIEGKAHDNYIPHYKYAYVPLSCCAGSNTTQSAGQAI